MFRTLALLLVLLALFTAASSVDVQTAITAAQRAIGSQERPPSPSADDANPLLLEFRLRNKVLSPAFPAMLLRQRVLCVPFKALCEALQIDGTVDLSNLRASGNLPEPHGAFAIDIKTEHLQIGSATVSIMDMPRAMVFEGDLYVDVDLLTAWLPVKFAFNYSRLELSATPTERLPIETAWEREAKHTILQKRQAQQELPEPDPPLVKHSLLSIPFLDVTVSSDYQSMRNDAPASRPFQRLQISGSGDFLFMNARWFTSGDWDKPFQIARLTLDQTDPNGRLLGPLKARQFALGDLWLAGSPLISKSRLGLGFEISSFPRQRSTEISKTTLAGDAMPGWDVELYRNEDLIAYQAASPDGTYRFEDVALLLGQNNFKILSYGPKGETREESKSVFVGGGLVKPGESHYRLAVMRQSDDLFASQNIGDSRDHGKTRFVAEYEQGLNSTTSVGASLIGAPFQDQDRTYTGLGIRKSLGNSYGTLDFVRDNRGGWGLSAGYQTRFGDSNLSLELGRFGGGFVSEQIGHETRPLSLSSKARLDGSFKFGGWLPLAYSLKLEYDQDEFGNPDAVLSGRFATNLGGTLCSNSLQVGRRFDQIGRANGALGVRRRFGDFWYRTELGYSLDRPGIESLSLAADWIGSRDYRGQFGLRHEFRELGRSVVFAGLHRRTDTTSLGLTVEYGTDGYWTGGLVLSMGLGADPRSGKLMTSGDGFSAAGLVSARAYHDKNGNGNFDEGDVPLKGVRFVVGRRRLEGSTGAEGTILLKGLPLDKQVTLDVDPASLEDPSLAPSTKKMAVRARAGTAAMADFPLVCVADVQGMVSVMRDGKTWPAPGIEVVLMDVEGKEIGRTTSAYDGVYLFESVPPGAYSARLDSSQIDRLGLISSPSKAIRVNSDGTTADNPDFSLLPRISFKQFRMP